MENACKIKELDIFKLNGFVGKYMQLKVKNEESYIEGLVYTIDPVSESIILLQVQDEKIDVSIIMKHAILWKKLLDDIPLNLTAIDLTTVFSNLAQCHTDAVKPLKMKHVLKWLEISRIPYEALDNNAIKAEGVTIKPPYTPNDCVSDNPIKLMRFQKLLKTLSYLVENKDSRLFESS